MTQEKTDQPLILLTGPNGYVGGRLLPILEKTNYRLRCFTRRPESLRDVVDPQTEVVEGDALDADSVFRAMQGVDTVFYLIHSMGSSDDFSESDRQAAQYFAEAAKQHHVKRIVYLGGLGDPDHDLSAHLRSRQEIGEILRTSPASVIEFRASIIIGSGSLSFELIRALVERLPVMVCPKWVSVKAQPISIEDVLGYLVAALQLPKDQSEVFEIGGPDQISYGQIMKLYAKQRGLRRFMIPVPVLTPYLSSLWLGLVTPLYSRVGRKLVESLRNPTLVTNDLSSRTFDIRPRNTEQAISRALNREDQQFAQTRWSDALSSGSQPRTWGGVRFGSRIIDSRTRKVEVSKEQAFAPIRRIGGSTGWYYGDWLWKIRGFLDLLVGGVGVRRGRRDDGSLRVGDTLDFWRVEAFEDHRLLRLSAEMKLPGRAWLEFEIEEHGEHCLIRQTAIFDPIGIGGLAYWYVLYPLHQFVFAGMLRNICRAARSTQPAATASPQRLTASKAG